MHLSITLYEESSQYLEEEEGTTFVNRMYLVQLENSAQCRATQQVLYKLFTFKTIPNLQLKSCTR